MNHTTPRFRHDLTSECVFFLGLTSSNPDTAEEERARILSFMELQDRLITVSYPSGGPKHFISTTLREPELEELTIETIRNVPFLVLSEASALFVLLDRFPTIFEQAEPQVVILDERIDLRTWNQGADVGRHCFNAMARLVSAIRRVSTIATDDTEKEALKEKIADLQRTNDQLGFAITELESRFAAKIPAYSTEIVPPAAPAPSYSTEIVPPAAPDAPAPVLPAVTDAPGDAPAVLPAAPDAPAPPPPAVIETEAPKPVSVERLRKRLRALNSGASEETK
mgnify:CR=1 FL=1